jgi:DNA-directed RNA polymerase subunit beta
MPPITQNSKLRTQNFSKSEVPMPPLIEPVVLQPLIMPNDPGVDGLHRGNLERRSFARIHDAIDVPTLIETQINSFEWFRREGLRELFDEISPITDFTGKNMELRFLDYAFFSCGSWRPAS